MKITKRIKNGLRRLAVKTLFPVDDSRGWIPVFQESFLGAFQTDDPIALGDALSHPTVYACVTQIASDIGKLRVKMVRNQSGIWTEAETPAVLLRPNNFQITQKFIETWLISKLTYGNAYILKVRGPGREVKRLYVLDPGKVEPLVSNSGDVFYRLRQDNLTTVFKDIDAIPASEIIHDTMECLFHPLVGVPPLYAASLATSQGIAMQKNSNRFFLNNAQPGGILTAPGHIKDETAERIKTAWATKYTDDNVGKLAILGDGLKYEPLAVNAVDSALVPQLQWTDEKICSAYKVPPYKIHVGKPPTYQESETLDRKYYSDCLQRLIESIEALLALGLSLPAGRGIEFDLGGLLRMDISLKMKTAAEGVQGGIMAPNEGRRWFNWLPVQGGDTPYLQQQNYSLAALDERDKTNPLAVPEPPAEPDETEKALYLLTKKDLIQC